MKMAHEIAPVLCHSLAMRFTHIINLFPAAAGSEHQRAQSVTLASMDRAIREARTLGIAVEAIAVLTPEDAQCLGKGFDVSPCQPVAGLKRSALDLGDFEPPRALPLLADILGEGSRAGKGEYVVFTNADISLQPHFYIECDRMIREAGGSLSFAVNRRTIASCFVEPEQLEEMYKAESKAHPGIDCFVFPKRFIEQMDLADTFVGTRHFDNLLAANIDFLSDFQFQWHRNLFLTFHIGDDRTWVWRIDHEEFNLKEAMGAMSRLKKRLDEASLIPAESIFMWVDRGYLRHNSVKERLQRKMKRSARMVKFVRALREWRAISAGALASRIGETADGT